MPKLASWSRLTRIQLRFGLWHLLLTLVIGAGLGFGMPALASVADLRAAAEAHAGRSVRLDPRLAIPACPAGYAFEESTGGMPRLRASCPQTGWHMWIPIGAPDVVDNAALRRGQLVRVRSAGPGFSVSTNAVVQSFNRREAVVILENPHSGQRFRANVKPDGSIEAM